MKFERFFRPRRGLLLIAACWIGILGAAHSMDKLDSAPPVSGPDLQLSISADQSNPGVYNNVVFNLVLENTGTEVMPNIVVDFPVPAGLAFVNQVVSAGTYLHWVGKWELPSLDPGQSESIALTLFTLNTGTNNVYAQVSDHDDFDIDSSPGNGTPPVPQEDDEAVVQINGVISCNFTAINVATGCFDNGTPSPDDDLYNLNIQPEGNNLATSYRIVATPLQSGGPGFNAIDVSYTGFYTSLSFPISSGGVLLRITDGSGDCSETIEVLPPAPCSTGGLPDLSISLDNTDSVEVALNTALNFNFFFQNIGRSGTYTFNNKLYLSTDQFLSADDRELSPVANRITIDNNLIYTSAATLFVDASIPIGDYWLLAKTDDLEEIAEEDEGNNLALRPIRVIDPNCSLEILTSPTVCFDQGTSIPIDDQFGFFIRTEANQANGSDYSLQINTAIGNSFVPFPIDYGQPFHISRFINNGPVEVIVTDNGNSGCTSSIIVDPPTPCSSNDPCPLSVNYSPPVCEGNGTPNNPADDEFSFSLFVKTIITGNNDTYRIELRTNNRVLNFVRPYQVDFTYRFPVDEGPVSIEIIDERDPSCTTSIVVPVPTNCAPVTPSTCANNLLSNPGYEDNSFPEGWFDLGGTSISNDANTGNNALRISGAAPGGILQNLPAVPGRAYTVSAFAKRTVGPPTSTGNYISLKFLSATWQPLDIRVDIIPAQNSYALYERTFTAPPGTAYVEAKAFKDVGDFELLVDDWCLTEGPGNPCAPDATPPVISNCPSDITVTTSGTSSTVDWTAPTATDNCAVVVFFPNFIPNLYEFPLGTSEVVYTARDAGGNETTCSFKVTILPQVGNQPDLTLADLQVPTSANLGTPVPFNVDLFNNGQAGASGAFTIRSWWSTDAVLSNDDVQDGVIPTGNLSANASILNIPGAATAVATLAPGPYYLILKVDADDRIIESDENNNVLVSSTPILLQANPNPGGVDLELDITASESTYDPWQLLTMSLLLENTGNAPATGIVVDFPLPDGSVFQGGNEYSASQGTYNPYQPQQWIVGDLAAGEAATITFNLFTVQSGLDLVGCGQVLELNESDSDSEPGNGNCQQVQEDDEAILVIKPSSSAPLSRQRQSDLLSLQQLYPNPTFDQLQVLLQSPTPQRVILSIYNSQGQRMEVIAQDLIAGVNQLSLAVAQLPAGLYYLHLPEAQRGRNQLRFVKMD